MKKLMMILILCMLVLSACKPVDVNEPAPVFDTGIGSNSSRKIFLRTIQF